MVSLYSKEACFFLCVCGGCRDYYNEQVFSKREVVLPHTGEVVAAYCTKDGCWYRARVIDTEDDVLAVSVHCGCTINHMHFL